MANEARHDAVSPNRANSGMTQWGAGANCDARAIDDGRHIVRMRALHLERRASIFPNRSGP